MKHFIILITLISFTSCIFQPKFVEELVDDAGFCDAFELNCGKRTIDETNDDLDNALKRLDKVEQLVKLQGDLITLNNNNQGIDLQNAVNSLQNQIDNLLDNQNISNSEIADLKLRVESLESLTASQGSLIELLDSDLDALASDLQSQIDNLASDLEVNSDNIDIIFDLLASLESDVSILQTNVVSLTNNVASNTTNISNMQTNINSLTNRVTALESLSNTSIVEIIDPCGDYPNHYDEVLIKLANNTIIAYFENGNKRFLAVLPNGNFQTTDNQVCNFNVNNGIVTQI